MHPGAAALCERALLCLLCADRTRLAALMLRLGSAWPPRCLSITCKAGCSRECLSANRSHEHSRVMGKDRARAQRFGKGSKLSTSYCRGQAC